MGSITKMEMLEFLVDDWEKGILSDGAALCAFHNIMRPQVPEPEAFEWAKRELANLKGGDALCKNLTHTMGKAGGRIR